MRAIIQRVKEAAVNINSSLHAGIRNGLLVFVGIEDSDNRDDIEWLAGKIVRLRIFNDENGIMNLSVREINGEIMVVSQFTLHASTRKGNRPSYIKASKPEIAIPMVALVGVSFAQLAAHVRASACFRRRRPAAPGPTAPGQPVEAVGSRTDGWRRSRQPTRRRGKVGRRTIRRDDDHILLGRLHDKTCEPQSRAEVEDVLLRSASSEIARSRCSGR